MVNEAYRALGSTRSCIRELFEFGRREAEKVGKENVFDFSLGNPSIPAPDEVTNAYAELLRSVDAAALHGYTSAPGADSVRDAVAADLEARFGMKLTRGDLYMTCGAAAALCSAIRALAFEPDAEIMAIAPYFPEYGCFIATGGARMTVVPPDRGAFQIDLAALDSLISEKTVAVIVNSPNNPSGAVYSRATLEGLAAILRRRSRQFGHPIYIISDEPYRELFYGDEPPAFIPALYENTVVCYSYSKSLSLPGERIGYVLIPPALEGHDDVYFAVAGAARSMGYVCAPSMTQAMVGLCASVRPDISAYRRNRDALYEGLTSLGYECALPEGAFYMFVKAPGGDANAFSERAKIDERILIVPGDAFACSGYLRISYCVDISTIERAMPGFARLIGRMGE